MGRRARPHEPRNGRQRAAALARGALFCAIISFVGCLPGLAASATAQTAASGGKAPTNPDKMLVEANELIYDKDNNTVSASGDAQLYYQGRVLQADKVTYDRKTKRVYAEGHVKFTDEKGDVTYGSRFDVTDDFRDGFIESVEVVSTDRTRFTSPRVERTNGDMAVLEKGTYTACEPCQDHPEKPPLWLVRAARIIHNQQTHVVYYEDAWLEVAGVPIVYLPYFSAPDPTVSRLSGFLVPEYIQNNTLGVGVGVPYFFNLAPNYDLTVKPTYLSRQGLFGDVEWRQRLATGSYNIRGTGIYQLDPSAFDAAPYGAGTRRWRGSLESEGQFYINDKWKYGWDVTLLSDRFYYNDYKIKAGDLSNYYFQDSVSSVYLRGQGDRSYFDLSGYRFEGLTANDFQQQLPVAAPVLDYNKTISMSPEKSGGIGGEVTFDFNAANITRAAAAYQAVGAQTLDQAYSLYNVCTFYVPGQCLLRGIAGDYARATGQISWQRKIVDPLGEEWTPFVFARLSGSTTSLNTSDSFTFSSTNGTSVISNSNQPAFFSGSQNATTAQAMPGVGLEYRYPFVSSSWLGRQVIEPIAQLIVRPNEVLPSLQPNEDAQSLVFDETNLFAWDKYSGYDRVEGGTRLNYGVQYTSDFNNGGHANIIGGESIQVAGQNSYTMADAANTGLESGLDKKYSNFVAGETIAPFSSALSFTSKQQFDSANFSLARFDALVNFNYANVVASLDYARYAAQPMLGWPQEREGIVANAKYNIVNHWNVNGSVIFDMSRHLYDLPGQSTPRFFATNYGVGVGYTDECTTLNLSYLSRLSDPIAATPSVRDQTITLQLTLRTLGDVRASTGVQ
jgi:LPS-assembly protein